MGSRGGPGEHPGRNWHLKCKKTQNANLLKHLGNHFGYLSDWGRTLFFVVLGGCFFSASWASFGCPSARKGVKMIPKLMKKLSGSISWNVLEPLYLLYGRHMGRSRGESGNHFFFRLRREGLSGGFCRGARTFVLRFCEIVGSLGKVFLMKKFVLFFVCF